MRTHPIVAALLLSALTGCSQQTLNSAQNDANRNAAVVNQKAQQVEKQTRPQLNKLEMQSRVSAALAAANLPTTVHVRADADGVYLRGSVKSSDDKALAGQITRHTLGPDRAVHNELRVSGG